MFKNYIFDLYGTLVDIRTDEENEALWDRIALYCNYKGTSYTGETFHREYDRLCREEKKKILKAHPQYKNDVEINVDNVIRQLFNNAGVTVSDSEVRTVCSVFRCYSTEFIRLYNGVIDLLDTLKKKGKKIYLLSNAQRSFTMNEMNMLGLTPYFDGIFISSDKEVRKPSLYYYNGLIEQFGLDKKESVMIGNDYDSDINGSKAAGLKSLYIHQEISPDIEGIKINTPWQILDGDVYKIKEILIK